MSLLTACVCVCVCVCVFFLFGTDGRLECSEMRGSLLMLSVLLAFITEHEGKLTVYYLPRFPKVYVGDDITVICGGAESNKQTEWKINGATQPTKNSFMVLTGVTPENNGIYTCEQNGEKSELTIEVLVLEPYAQLSTPEGGPVIAKGDARNLKLQVDDEVKDWKCYVLRDKSGFRLQFKNDSMKTATLFAEMKDTQSATFWCLHNKTKERSNAVTLKMTDQNVMLEPPAMHVMQGENVALRCAVWGGAQVEQADFFKDSREISKEKDDTYIIENASEGNNGQYKCSATYRYSHISSEAVKRKAESEPQLLKVIGGPPVASLSLIGETTLECSCPQCPGCETYHWYHTSDASNIRTKLDETSQTIDVNDAGLYTCRAFCKKGYSRFSNGQRVGGSDGDSKLGVIVAALLIVLGVLIIVVVALKCRQRRGNRMEAIGQDKGDGAKDKSGGDYERIGLTDKADYQTLGEATGQAPAEGGYEALKKTEEKDVYHMLGPGEGPSPAEDQAGYEALKNVKVQVYQTLSSDESKKPAGESEGGYEQLPQKTGDYQDVAIAEENPYEELKAEKKGKVDQ